MAFFRPGRGRHQPVAYSPLALCVALGLLLTVAVEPPVVAAEEQAPQLRVRTEGPLGVFLVYDAAIPPMHPRAEPGYVAYWNDFDTRMLYVYGGLLFELADVGHALLNLERDLGIDAEMVSAPSEALQSGLADAASEVVSPKEWFPASYGTILEIMGIDPGDPSNQFALDGHVPLGCSGPASSLPTLQPPGPDISPRRWIELGVLAGGCIPGPGGGSPPSTDDCPGDIDCDGIPDWNDPDIDGDGIPNGSDPDVDGDGIPNGEDPDVDGDGIPNGSDPDVDGDGIPNGNDPDIDGDGLRNGSDDDVDGDGIPNGDDPDADGDGIPNEDDPEPNGCDADCPAACCNTSTGGCSLKRQAQCSGSNERYQGNETSCLPNPCCPFGTNPTFPATSATISRTAPTWSFSGCISGATEYEVIRRDDVTVSAVCDGAEWCAVLTGLSGQWSQDVRLLPCEQEVTGPGGNTTELNFCDQVINLDALGFCCPTGAWSMIRAVQVHEDVHATRLLPALQNVTPGIEQQIEGVCVPHAPGKTLSTAITEIRRSRAFREAVGNPDDPAESNTANALWRDKYFQMVAQDDNQGGPTEQAEHAVFDPMVGTICIHSDNQCWPYCSTCSPRLTGGCCNLAAGTCSIGTRCACEDSDGSYRGNGTDCGPPNPCVGACCFGGTCTLTTPTQQCAGTSLGLGTTCSPNPCLPHE